MGIKAKDGVLKIEKNKTYGQKGILRFTCKGNWIPR